MYGQLVDGYLHWVLTFSMTTLQVNTGTVDGWWRRAKDRIPLRFSKCVQRYAWRWEHTAWYRSRREGTTGPQNELRGLNAKKKAVLVATLALTNLPFPSKAQGDPGKVAAK